MRHRAWGLLVVVLAVVFYMLFMILHALAFWDRSRRGGDKPLVAVAAALWPISLALLVVFLLGCVVVQGGISFWQKFGPGKGNP